MSNSADVLIVGAGPVGLAMATALHHHGLTCRLIDKAPAPSDKSKALVVWSRTLELLDKFGLAQTFINDGLKLKGASIRNEGKQIVHLAITGLDSPYCFPLMIPQNETERLLAEHLAARAITVERQVELVAFGEKADGVSCTLRFADGHEETADYPWVVGCDGAHSTVRHTLGVPFTGAAEPNDWILADVHLHGNMSRDEISVFWHTKGVLVFFPIGDTRFRMVADLGMAQPGGKPADPTLAEAQAKVDERGPGGITLTDPIWLAGFRINERKVDQYRHGRVMLAGDAAHIHSPAGGQGMNTGMQDAFNLAWKLALVHKGQGQAEPLLGSYSHERSSVGDQVLRGAATMTTVATLRNPVAQFMRNHIAPIVTSFGIVQDKIKNAICELSINYRDSSLSAEDWPMLGGGLPAGDRLPDSPLTSAVTGQPTSLFTVTKGTQHDLLLFPAANDATAIATLTQLAEDVQQAFPIIFATHVIFKPTDKPTAPVGGNSQVWIDVDELLDKKLSITHPTVIVVRPDGYIGYRGQPAESAKVMNYLRSYLVAG